MKSGTVNGKAPSENLCPNHKESETPKHKVCVDCDEHKESQWAKMAWHVRCEWRRFKIEDTERRLLDALCDVTFGWGREDILVPELRYFVSMTGLQKPHVTDALKSLHLQRLIRIQKVKGQYQYSIRTDSENWQTTPRELMLDRDEKLNQLREVNGIPQEAPNFFKVRPGTKNFDAGVTASVIHDVITELETDLS